MSGVALSPDILKAQISHLDSVEPAFAGGGFKWVHAAMIKGKKEALKVLAIQKVADTDADMVEAYAKEQVARVRREIEASGRLACADILRRIALVAGSNVQRPTPASSNESRCSSSRPAAAAGRTTTEAFA
jgi:hypothetical protein